MKKALCRIFAVIMAICLLAGAAITVSADSPMDSYTYWTNVGNVRKSVYGKAMYDVGDMIDVTKLGVSKLTQITSMCTDDDGNLYILDADSRIVILDKDYKFLSEIGLINGTISYNNATGIYYNNGVKEEVTCDKGKYINRRTL